MNPFSSAPLSRPASWQPSSSSTAAAQPSAGAGVLRQLFIDDINQAIGKDAALKEQHPSQGLQHEELTALRRERDRLAPMCTDDASALELAPHLGERVTRILTAAVHGVGLAVADHQSQQAPSVSFHGHSLEMKRPFLEEEDDVVGPEAGDPLIVHVEQFAGVAASVNPQKNLTAIEDLLDQQCKQARAEGKDSYRAATQARDAVMEAVLDGATTVMVDLPATLVTQLAQLGLTCRPKAQALPVQQRVAESKDGPELAGALAAAEAQRQAGPQQPAAVIAVAPSGIDHGLTQQQIHDSWMGKNSGRRADLLDALKKKDGAAVMALMGSLKGAGLNPQQIGEILAAKDSDGKPGLYWALVKGHAPAVTAYMDGLKGAGLSPQQIGELLAAKRSDGAPGLFWALDNGHAPAVTAFMAGLKGADLSPQQIGEILAAKNSAGIPGLLAALVNGQAPAVTAYMDGLKGAGLSPQKIGELLAAKIPDGTPGLAAALMYGHAPAVTAYIDGLKGAGLSPQKIGELLAAKDPNGIPGLYYAKKNRKADAEAAYMNGLRDLQRHNLITAQQIDAIVSASGGGRV